MTRRLYLVLIMFLCSTMFALAQMKWNSAYQQYFDQYRDLAIQQMGAYGVPASITLAQGVIESGAGKSRLATKANNHFGIKCHGWTGGKIYHDDDERNECFRAYDSPYDSFEDHSKFLRNGKRYSSLFSLNITDYKGWARGLKAAGYATNPQYADLLIGIIQLYKLYQYDTAKGYDKFIVRHEKGHSSGFTHRIYAYNNNYYIKVRANDTFASLADEMGISVKKLAKYNERDVNDRLSVGEPIYLKKKATIAPKEYKDRLHYVRAGESMYSIAQTYGIRLKSLYKLNNLRPDYQLRVGDKLRLR